MNLEILPGGLVDLEMMRDLGELCSDLQEADIQARGASAVLPGVKDGGLTVGIAAAGLLLSSISSAVSVLTYWNSRKPRYTLTIEHGNQTVQIANMNQDGVKALVESMDASAESRALLVRVAAK
jgi:hypothetical protein